MKGNTTIAPLPTKFIILTLLACTFNFAYAFANTNDCPKGLEFLCASSNQNRLIMDKKELDCISIIKQKVHESTLIPQSPEDFYDLFNDKPDSAGKEIYALEIRFKPNQLKKMDQFFKSNISKPVATMILPNGNLMFTVITKTMMQTNHSKLNSYPGQLSIATIQAPLGVDFEVSNIQPSQLEFIKRIAKKHNYPICKN